MSAALELIPQELPRATHDADGDRFVLDGITWSQYVAIREALEPRPGVRITFSRGDLEIRTPSRAHEDHKKSVARLLEAYALVNDIECHAHGSTTFRDQPRERGLEPDECYCIGDPKEIPDIAIEVALSSGGLPKLEVYRGIGVPEVWFWRNDRLELYEFIPGEGVALGRYQAISKSRFVPHLDLAELARFARMEKRSEAVRLWYKLLITSATRE